jgi:hypothetical protein
VVLDVGSATKAPRRAEYGDAHLVVAAMDSHGGEFAIHRQVIALRASGRSNTTDTTPLALV